MYRDIFYSRHLFLVILSIIGIYLNWHLGLLFLGLVVLNWFDVIGFFGLIKAWKPENNILSSPQKLKDYRTLQVLFYISSILLFGFLAKSVGVVIGLCILLWTAVQDILFYFTLGIKLDEKWTWVFWSPVGIVAKLLKKSYVPRKVIIAQGIVGAILAIIAVLFI